ncbi:multiheme c-type cytochrome [Chitinophaga rhizosphaerae]|uniref:multiheme c-type cytochrome n=1 Tax=Chitinophaga rhizosphaerae TaxID=1864947 RepID=UPI0013DFAC60|nr:multiheme c-type cytochrome [Chitinophaga rhizosphaerae]
MKKRPYLLVGAATVLVGFLSRCSDRKAGPADPRGSSFAEAASCAQCHKTIYDDYAVTAHAHSSAVASAGTVKGRFTAPDNIFHFAGRADVVMEQQGEELFQVVKSDGRELDRFPFDVVFGSGRKAQTFLYWKGGQYFQLPISWFVPADNWANSPGFPADHPKFDRVIPSTCFGCHSSMVKVREETKGITVTEQFARREMIGGIDCQRCHGPAAEHVAFHTNNPAEKVAHFITRIDTLSRVQRLDMCALCHSGLKPMYKPAFAFKPGDALSDFVIPTVPFRKKPDQLDVHGNQLQLLAASQCFLQSKTMNCSTCHNPHVTERTSMQTFSQRCMTCHQPGSSQFCKHTGKPEEALEQNCIDCHMPALPSGAITLLTNGEQSPTPDSVRTHLIDVYADVVRRMK